MNRRTLLYDAVSTSIEKVERGLFTGSRNSFSMIRPYSSVLTSPRCWWYTNCGAARRWAATIAGDRSETLWPLRLQEVAPKSSTAAVSKAQEYFILFIRILPIRTDLLLSIARAEVTR